MIIKILLFRPTLLMIELKSPMLIYHCSLRMMTIWIHNRAQFVVKTTMRIISSRATDVALSIILIVWI